MIFRQRHVGCFIGHFDQLFTKCLSEDGDRNRFVKLPINWNASQDGKIELAAPILPVTDESNVEVFESC